MQIHHSYILLLQVFNHAIAFDMKGDTSTINIQRSEASGGSKVVELLYDTCECYDGDNKKLSQGSQCVATLVDYMLRAVAFAAERYTAALVTTGKDNANQYSWDDVVDTANDKSSKRSEAFHATHFTASEIHRRDGLAAHINVRGSDSALVVDTNGTHATAQLKPTSLDKRSYLRTNFNYFKFDGVWGIKLQAHGINGSTTADYARDLTQFATKFATKDDTKRGDFVMHNSWNFKVCNHLKQALFYGKIVAEEDKPSKEYETKYAYEYGETIECVPREPVKSAAEEPADIETMSAKSAAKEPAGIETTSAESAVQEPVDIKTISAKTAADEPTGTETMSAKSVAEEPADIETMNAKSAAKEPADIEVMSAYS